MMRKKCGRPGSSGLSAQVIKDLEREIAVIGKLVNSSNVRVILIDRQNEQPIYMNQNMKDYLSEWKLTSSSSSDYLSNSNSNSIGSGTSSGSFSGVVPNFNNNNNNNSNGHSSGSFSHTSNNNNTNPYSNNSNSNNNSSKSNRSGDQHVFAIKLHNLQMTVASLVSFFPEMKQSNSVHIKSNVTLFSCYQAKLDQHFTVAFFALYDRDMQPMMNNHSVGLLASSDEYGGGGGGGGIHHHHHHSLSNSSSSSPVSAPSPVVGGAGTQLGSIALHNLDTRLVDVGMQEVLTNMNLIMGTALGIVPPKEDGSSKTSETTTAK